ETTASGGGWSGGGGVSFGGSRNTMVVSARIRFTVSAAPRVAQTPPATIRVWNTIESTIWRPDLLFFGLDSIRLSNTAPPTGWMRRGKATAPAFQYPSASITERLQLD